MKSFWTADAHLEYEKATGYYNYPEVPFGDLLREMIRPTDVVADIGCGFGVVSLWLSRICRHVIAIDQDETAIRRLQERMQEEGIANITTHLAIWPDVDCDDWDVAVSMYHHRFAYTQEKIDTLAKKTRREGLVTAQGIRERVSFHEPMREILGLEQRDTSCENGCYVRGRLEQAGFTTDCKLMPHDFGQPVDSFEKGVDFMMRQLKLEDDRRKEVEALAPQWMEQVGDQQIVKILRENCVIRFQSPKK